MPVNVVEKDILAMIAAAHEGVNRTRKLNSKLAGHRRHLSSLPNCAKKKSTAYGLTPF